MFLYHKTFCIVLSCIALSFSQDTKFLPIYNASFNNLRLNNRAPEDIQPNLWLISRDDPIPASLNGQILTRSYASNDQLGRVQRSDYGMRLPLSSTNKNIESAPELQQSPIAYISQAPVAYDRTVTSENRRQIIDGNAQSTQNPETVLVQLPRELTEGLWVRPQYQTFNQPRVRRRQNVDGVDSNIKFDEFVKPEEQDEPLRAVPIRELTSRLPNTEFSSQSELNVQDQHREFPYQIISQLLQGLNGINASHPNSNAPESWLFHNEPKPSSDNITDTRFYELPPSDASSRNAQTYEFGVLTNEDIELLERLGILSSLVIEPIQPENIDNFTSVPNSQREYESEPVLIDNGGQIFLGNSGRESANLDDVVLIDIPQFTTSEYHTDVPENVENRGEGQFPEIYPSENVAENHLKQLEKSNVQNNTHLTDRQILEILQILGSNTGNLLNLSIPIAKKSEPIASVNKSYGNSSKITDQGTLNSKNVPNSNLSSTSSDIAVSSSVLQSISNGTQQTITDQSNFAPPSVSNGRIQPRLLEKLTLKDNEIVEKLFAKTIPVSESKIELLKKLQDQPKPYIFGFNQDDGNGTLQHRNEKSDASGVVKGTYGYRDALGVYRNVSYIADSNGFHAVVKTNEPGTVSHNTADVVFVSQTPPLGALIKMMAYRRSKKAFNTTKAP